MVVALGVRPKHEFLGSDIGPGRNKGKLTHLSWLFSCCVSLCCLKGHKLLPSRAVLQTAWIIFVPCVFCFHGYQRQVHSHLFFLGKKKKCFCCLFNLCISLGSCYHSKIKYISEGKCNHSKRYDAPSLETKGGIKSTWCPLKMSGCLSQARSSSSSEAIALGNGTSLFPVFFHWKCHAGWPRKCHPAPQWKTQLEEPELLAWPAAGTRE